MARLLHWWARWKETPGHGPSGRDGLRCGVVPRRSPFFVLREPTKSRPEVVDHSPHGGRLERAGSQFERVRTRQQGEPSRRSERGADTGGREGSSGWWHLVTHGSGHRPAQSNCPTIAHGGNPALAGPSHRHGQALGGRQALVTPVAQRVAVLRQRLGLPPASASSQANQPRPCAAPPPHSRPGTGPAAVRTA